MGREPRSLRGRGSTLLAIELAVELLASWTLAYHLCLVLDLPAVAIGVPFSLVFVALQWIGRARLRASFEALRSDPLAAFGVAAMGAAVGVYSLFRLTPSADDFNFFHRALYQLGHLSEPFATGDTAFNRPGLIAISPLHVLTSYELLVAMGAEFLGLDPLGAYHNGASWLANLLIAVTCAALFRELGLERRAAVVATAGALLFLLLDDTRTRSLGLAHHTLWMGKSLQWLVLLPATAAFTLRYVRHPTLRHALPVALACVCAVGTSGTGVFLAPGMVAAAAFAGFVAGPRTPARALRISLLGFATAYCVGVALLLAAGVLSRPEAVAAWTDAHPADWGENLMLVFANAGGVLRAALLLFAVPALALRGRARVVLLALSAALVLLFANPISGPLWIDAVLPGSYWRVALLFPLPLCFGAACAAVLGFCAPPPGALLRAGVAALVVGACLAPRLLPAPEARAMRAVFAHKAPLALRFEPAELRFLRQVAPALSERNLLAGHDVVTTAALLEPSLRVEAARLQDTRHLFANAGESLEGERRVQAWSWVSRCEPWPPGAQSARRSLEAGVDALIFRDCGAAALAIEHERRAVLDGAPGEWWEVHRSDGYVLMLRR